MQDRQKTFVLVQKYSFWLNWIAKLWLLFIVLMINTGLNGCADMGLPESKAVDSLNAADRPTALGQDTPTPQPEETSGSKMISPTNDSSAVIIEYRRSGGFAGLDDYLTIAANGKVSLTRRKQYKAASIDDITLEQLQQQFVQAGFSSLEPTYLPANTCCDLVAYTLVYQGHTVQTMDTAKPSQLESILKSLNQIIDNK